MNIVVEDIPEMYAEVLYRVWKYGTKEETRNGPVKAIQGPLLVEVNNPQRRVLLDPERNANPFFHVMEFVWMMSGTQKPDWIMQFNTRFEDYADTNNVTGQPLLHGAYGHRWRNYFKKDQIRTCIRMLRKDPTSRRVMLAMWDPLADLFTHHNDLPCNTHVYLRITNNARGMPSLDMTVCNRSNDIVWGMTGANAVHMTFVQELIAQALAIQVGKYYILSNNAHVYCNMPTMDVAKVAGRLPEAIRPQKHEACTAVNLLGFGENELDFLDLCYDFVHGRTSVKNFWLEHVAMPMAHIYLARKNDGQKTERSIELCESIADDYWRLACKQWLQRKLDPVV